MSSELGIGKQIRICFSGATGASFYFVVIVLSLAFGGTELARIPFSNIDLLKLLIHAGLFLPFIYIISHQLEFATPDIFQQKLPLTDFLKKYYLFAVLLVLSAAGFCVSCWYIVQTPTNVVSTIMVLALLPYYIYIPLFNSAYRRLVVLRGEKPTRAFLGIPYLLYLIPILLSIVGLVSITIADYVFGVIEATSVFTTIVYLLCAIIILAVVMILFDYIYGLLSHRWKFFERFSLWESNTVRWGFAVVVLFLCPFFMGGFIFSDYEWLPWESISYSFRTVGVVAVVVLHFFVFNLLKYIEGYYQSKLGRLKFLDGSTLNGELSRAYSTSVRRYFGWQLAATLTMPLIAVYLELGLGLLFAFLVLDFVFFFFTSLSIPRLKQSMFYPLEYFLSKKRFWNRRRRLFLARGAGTILLLVLVLLTSTNIDELNISTGNEIEVHIGAAYLKPAIQKVEGSWREHNDLVHAVQSAQLTELEAEVAYVLRFISETKHEIVRVCELAEFVGSTPFEVIEAIETIEGTRITFSGSSDIDVSWFSLVEKPGQNRTQLGSLGVFFGWAVTVIVAIIFALQASIVPNKVWYVFHFVAIFLGFVFWFIHNSIESLLTNAYQLQWVQGFNMLSNQIDGFGFGVLSIGYGVLSIYVTVFCYFLDRQMKILSKKETPTTTGTGQQVTG